MKEKNENPGSALAFTIGIAMIIVIVGCMGLLWRWFKFLGGIL